MALTVTTVSEFVRRRLDGEPSVPMMTLANQAGEYLVNSRPWGWLARKPVSLKVSANSTKIKLPDDFGRAIGEPKPTESSSYTFRWSTPDRVAAERAFGSPSVFSGYISWEADVDGNQRPYIELSFAPTSSESDTFLLAYTAKWKPVTTDTEYLAIPDWMEPLYLQVLMAFAQGYDESDVASLDLRLAEIMAGPIFNTCARRDGSMQPTLGSMRNGAVQGLAARERTPWTYGTSIAAYDPS